MNKIALFALIFLASCQQSDINQGKKSIIPKQEAPYIVVLGTVQDAGSPHAGCQKTCCKNLFTQPDPTRLVTCLGVVDPISQKQYLLEASPDLPRQMKFLQSSASQNKEVPDGIFLTHGHFGHYSGLMYLGKESMNALKVPTYAMPRMKLFLESNGPWDQLVKIGNIDLSPLLADSTIKLTNNLSITPFTVPHRDEYSETVGYKIQGPNKSALFIPDIDKWSKWDQSILAKIKEVDYAFLDATFYDGDEVNRDISEIPHPFVVESMMLFETLELEQKKKIHFIHLNHTNPLLEIEGEKANFVKSKGYNIATFLHKLSL